MVHALKTDLFSLQSVAGETRLYASELSTVEALAFFEPQSPVVITEFGAQRFRSSNWMSEKDLPALQSVYQTTEFLNVIGNDNAADWWDLVDFSAMIGNNMRISSHDDGEVKFISRSSIKILEILQALVEKCFPARYIHLIQANMGKYVLLQGNGYLIFNSFDEYNAHIR